MRTLLVDVDDVLLNWVGAFKKFLKKKGVSTNGDLPSQWDLRPWVNHPDVLDLIDEFNHSEHFEYLEPDHEAVVALARLYSHGFQIYAITSCTDEAPAIERRKSNLNSHFGPLFEDVICLPLGGCKLKTLKNFPRGSFWVEDKLENAVAGLKAGHRAILLDKSHNQGGDHPEVTRCESWSEVCQLIIQETIRDNNAITHREKQHIPQE